MILDVTVGSRKIYHGWDKNLNPSIIGIDVRKGDFSIEDEHHWAKGEVVIDPTILADMKYLPFRDNIFDIVIFDPPHTECGLNSWLGRYYGSWTQHERIQTTRLANEEFRRVLKREGILILKVMPRQFAIYETLLKNFVFFLPIYTYRARGSFANPKPKADGALWAIGKHKLLEVVE